NKDLFILDLIGEFEKGGGLLLARLHIDDRDIEVAQPQLFGSGLFFGSLMFIGRAQIDDHLHAFGFELVEKLKRRLPACADVLVYARKIWNGNRLLYRLGTCRRRQLAGKAETEKRAEGEKKGRHRISVSWHINLLHHFIHYEAQLTGAGRSPYLLLQIER